MGHCQSHLLIKDIYELLIEKLFFKSLVAKRASLVTQALMATKYKWPQIHRCFASEKLVKCELFVSFSAEQYDCKKYVKPDIFFMRCLREAKKKRSLSTSTSTYKHQRDELSHLSKLNLPCCKLN